MYVPSSQMSFNFLCVHNQSMIPLKTRVYLTVMGGSCCLTMTVKAKLKSDCTRLPVLVTQC